MLGFFALYLITSAIEGFTGLAICDSKTNLGSTIHYNTYTSYNKYFRLCMVSEELRLNEIGLHLVTFACFQSNIHVV